MEGLRNPVANESMGSLAKDINCQSTRRLYPSGLPRFSFPLPYIDLQIYHPVERHASSRNLLRFRNVVKQDGRRVKAIRIDRWKWRISKANGGILQGSGNPSRDSAIHTRAKQTGQQDDLPKNSSYPRRHGSPKGTLSRIGNNDERHLRVGSWGSNTDTMSGIWKGLSVSIVVFSRVVMAMAGYGYLFG